MIHFLDDLAHNGPGGSDTPRRPKGDLASLLGNKKPSNKLCGDELHKYLIKSLLYTDVANQPGCAKDGIYTDLDQISPHLVGGYERVRKQIAMGLRVFLEYGCWLELAYELGRNGWQLLSAFVRVILKCWEK